ncbi:hypothetical protein Ndes2437B_g02083 [Nannochloris sp. 'desiccata']
MSGKEINADLIEFPGFEGELLWGAEEHSILDTLGAGEISASVAHCPIQDGSYADQFTNTNINVVPQRQNDLITHHTAASIATSDTSHMQSMDTGVSSKSAKRGPRPRLFKKHRCQADGCHANLSTYSFYYQRNHICTEHLKSESFIVHGVPSRFCQRCGLSHALTEFDGKRKSCRVALEKHNNRRKARLEGAAAAGSMGPPKSPAVAAAVNAQDGGVGNFAGYPGVADLSGWDPNLAKELEALLSDDPIIELPMNYVATAASGVIGTNNLIPTAGAMALPSGEVHLGHAGSSPLGTISTMHPLQTGMSEQRELGFDGQPLSPTLLRLARIDTNSKDYDYQQMMASSPFEMDLPFLNTITQQQQQQQQQQEDPQPPPPPPPQSLTSTTAMPFSFPFTGMGSSTATPKMELESSAPQQIQQHQQQQQQQQQQHPIQFIVVAPGMSLPDGIQVIPHPGAVGAAGAVSGMHMAMQFASQQQQQGTAGNSSAADAPGPIVVQPMQWVLMPSNMVMMQHSLTHHHQQQQQQQEGSCSQPEEQN